MENFSGQPRDAFLNETRFTSLAQARRTWRTAPRLQYRPAHFRIGRL